MCLQEERGRREKEVQGARVIDLRRKRGRGVAKRILQLVIGERA